jgi:hypothetical protein
MARANVSQTGGASSVVHPDFMSVAAVKHSAIDVPAAESTVTEMGVPAAGFRDAKMRHRLDLCCPNALDGRKGRQEARLSPAAWRFCEKIVDDGNRSRGFDIGLKGSGNPWSRVRNRNASRLRTRQAAKRLPIERSGCVVLLFKKFDTRRPITLFLCRSFPCDFHC